MTQTARAKTLGIDALDGGVAATTTVGYDDGGEPDMAVMRLAASIGAAPIVRGTGLSIADPALAGGSSDSSSPLSGPGIGNGSIVPHDWGFGGPAFIGFTEPAPTVGKTPA